MKSIIVTLLLSLILSSCQEPLIRVPNPELVCNLTNWVVVDESPTEYIYIHYLPYNNESINKISILSGSRYIILPLNINVPSSGLAYTNVTYSWLLIGGDIVITIWGQLYNGATAPGTSIYNGTIVKITYN